MTKYKALFKVSFLGMLYSMNLSRGGKKRKFSGALVLALAGGLMVLLSCTYSFSMGDVLSHEGGLEALPMVMALLAMMMCAIFSVFGAQGILFGTKDMDLALSWPVSSFALMLSRLSALYLQNWFLLTLWMIPTWVAWFWYGGVAHPVSLVPFLVGCIFLAVLPTLLSMVVGYLMAWVSSHFTGNPLLSNLLALAALLAVMAGSFLFSGGTGAMGWVSQVALFFPLAWFLEGLTSPLAMAKLALITLLPLGAITWLFSRNYVGILTRLCSHGAKHNYRLTRQRATNQFPALLKREAQRYFGISIYFINTAFGLILLLALAGLALWKKEFIAQQLQLVEGLDFPLLPLCGLVLGFLLAMTNITCCSISLEGQNLWILKEAPLSCATIFGAKTALQLLLTLPVMVISIPLFGWALGLSALQTGALLVGAITFCLCTAPLGLLCNLYLPNLDAPNPTVVVKQSAATLVGLVTNLILLLPATGLCFLLPQWIQGVGWLLLSGAIYVLLALIFWRILMTKGARLFYELS